MPKIAIYKYLTFYIFAQDALNELPEAWAGSLILRKLCITEFTIRLAEAVC